MNNEEKIVNQAEQVILENVYAPALLQKLSTYGIVAQSEKEAAELVSIGLTLSGPRPEQGSRFAKAASALYSFSAPSAASDSDYMEAAQQLAQDNLTFQAASLLSAV